nr:unnamed protein product [Spirometra erinaceieuropaei]
MSPKYSLPRLQRQLPLLLAFFLILLLNLHTTQVAARERSWPDLLGEGILQKGDEDDVQYDLEEEVEEEEEEAVEEPGRATNPLAAAGWLRRVRERIRRLPLLLVFFLILLLNVHTTQAAARERIWPDRLEEGILPRGVEDDVQYDLEDEEWEEEVEEPGRAANPLTAAGWWRRVRERISRALRGRLPVVIRRRPPPPRP